jgi:DNA recombination protein RmuC
LKKVLTNIKTRGTWGEVQLGTLLDQILTPEQYASNVVTKLGSHDRVEFAIRLPGRSLDDHEPVWLPVDAKFPLEDYQRLLDAQEQANAPLVEEAGRMLEARIKLEGKTIREKYLDPPRTTDFAIMFLPTEGLFAEVIRRAGLSDTLQREYRVTIAGPTTLTAILNSLQMGFRTLAIERRSSEVWALLAAVKTEFGRFGEILDKTKRKLDEASSSIESAATRTRQIERKLKAVQTLPAEEAPGLLGEPENTPARLED